MSLALVDHRGNTLQPTTGDQFAIENERRTTRRQLTKELGVAGTTFFSGFLQDDQEHNQKLSGQSGIKIYNEMRRSDASISEILNAWMLPILGAEPIIDWPENPDEASRVTQEHIDFARNNLFTRINFRAYLEHALTAFWAGYSWFEKVYEQDQGQLVIKRISPRLASTLSRWWTDDRGELMGVEQEVLQGGKFRTVDVPRDKMVLFTFRKEANNYSGNSLLRALYPHYLIKQSLYKIDAIRHERFAVGVPVITLPDGYDHTLLNLAKAIGKNWRGAEQSYVLKVPDMEIEIMHMRGYEALNLIPTIEHHNEMLARGTLMGFFNLGHTESGSRSLGQVGQEIFYDAIEAVGDWVARTTMEEVLWPTMDLNFPNKPRPVLKLTDVGSISLTELILSMRDLGLDFFSPTLETENHIRERISMPIITRQDFDRAHPDLGLASEDDEGSDPVPDNDPPQEGPDGDFEARLVERAPEWMAVRQIWGFVGDTTCQLKQLVEQFEGPHNELVEKMGGVFKEVYAFGMDTVEQEIGLQSMVHGVTPIRVRIRDKTILSRQVQLMGFVATNDDVDWTLPLFCDLLAQRCLTAYKESGDLGLRNSVAEAVNNGRDYTFVKYKDTILKNEIVEVTPHWVLRAYFIKKD